MELPQEVVVIDIREGYISYLGYKVTRDKCFTLIISGDI